MNRSSVIDGGVYDNSGMDIVAAIMKEEEAYPVAGNAARAPFILIACQSLSRSALEAYIQDSIPIDEIEPDALEVPLSLPKAAIASLFGRNADAERAFLGRYKPKLAYNVPSTGDLVFAPFFWDPVAVDVPLGWYLSGSRARAISFQLGFRQTFAAKGLSVLKTEMTGIDLDRGDLEKAFHVSDETFAKLKAMRDLNKKTLVWIEGAMSQLT